MRMLLDMNGGVCEVVTGVTIVYPVLEAPGYNIKYVTIHQATYISANINLSCITGLSTSVL